MSLDVENLKFTIFGSGYDYTRIDSGSGEGERMFSHPFIPLNSIAYSRQYRLLVPDNEGNIIDAPYEDIGHCTFDPALGTVFDTEGEVELKITYHREYEEDGQVLVVHKEGKQKITVVDHGTVSVSATASYQRDVYSDGYIYWRPHPQGLNTYRDNAMRNIKKSSSLPWHASTLGGGGSYYFISSGILTDISELAYADASELSDIRNLFQNCSTLEDISALAEWKIHPYQMDSAFRGCSKLANLSPISNWDLSGCIGLSNVFTNCISLADLSPIANWDTSKALRMSGTFAGCTSVTDLSPLANWNTSKVTDMSNAFGSTRADVAPLGNWDVSKVTNFSRTFSGCTFTKVDGLKKWDVSSATNMTYMFEMCLNLVDLDDLENWNVSNVTDFSSMFSTCSSLENIEPLSSWDITKATRIVAMFNLVKVSDISPINNWDFSNNPTMTNMFYYSHASNPDASPAQSWNVVGTGKKVFDTTTWSNVPSWN